MPIIGHPIIGHMTDNRPLPYRCISKQIRCWRINQKYLRYILLVFIYSLFHLLILFTHSFSSFIHWFYSFIPYVDEDYPARPEIKQSLTGWGDNCGSESSTLETDVCVWRYALIVVHATQEEEVPCPTWSCCPQYWKAAAAHQKTLVKECWSHTSNSIWPSFYSARRHGRCPRLSLANSLCCHVFTAGVTWLVGTSESEQYCCCLVMYVCHWRKQNERERNGTDYNSNFIMKRPRVECRNTQCRLYGPAAPAFAQRHSACCSQNTEKLADG